MVADDARKSHNVKLIDILCSYFVSISFLLVISVFIVSFFRKCISICSNIFKKKNLELSSRYEPLNITSGKIGQSGRNSPSLRTLESSYKKVEFEIPGIVCCESIQPVDISSGSGSSNAADSNEKIFAEEYVQPFASETLFSVSRKMQLAKKFAKKVELKSASKNASNVDIEGFKPELYQACPYKVQGASLFGKVKFTLQYEDKSMKKLIMMLHHIDLKFNKSHEQVNSLHISVVLLPEREYVYKTKDMERAVAISLHDTFSFQSRPGNRDFESRTILVIISYLCGITGKELPYGEARLPLLSHEIYSQVPTDISVGISPPSQAEIGDAKILLSFSSAQQNLNVIVKTVKFTNTMVFDKLSGIHIKGYLLRVDGGDKYGKKRTITKSFPTTTDSHLVSFQDAMSFDLDTDHYSLCSLKMSIHGKHRIMGKHLSLGKIRIGENVSNEGGKVHWKTALNSQEIAWTMWHPIYSN